jgi:hypoxanthine phosphoribosyltransferase
MTPDDALKVLAEADLICSAEKSALAIRRMASEITDRLATANPLVLAVMGGAVVFVGQLLPQLIFPLDFDYLQVSRYRDDTAGGELTWLVEPKSNVAGRCVLVVDDILDEGITLAAIRQRLFSLGAAEVLTAVFADKVIGVKTGQPADKPEDKPITADFVGITVPDRYVFGYGMDIQGAWRNLPSVYALNRETRQLVCS